jgi:hypothetical protein
MYMFHGDFGSHETDDIARQSERHILCKENMSYTQNDRHVELFERTRAREKEQKRRI